MLNWREQLIRVIDTSIKRNQIHKNLSVLRQHYFRNAEEQCSIQANRLMDLLRHAACHVPYYQRILSQAGVHVDGSIDLSRFHELPILSRDVLRERFEDLLSDDLSSRKWYRNSSGGSTGEPVSLVQDRFYFDYAMATKIFHDELVGYKLGEPYIKLWGSERDILHGTIGWRARLANSVRNRLILNCFCMTEGDMRRYAHIIQRTQPALVEAYVDGAYELARFINKNDLRISGTRAVIASAGNLFPFMRDEIEKAFKCEVFDRYGSREMGDMAFEDKRHAGLQVSTFTHFVEVVDEQGRPCAQGQEGQILVTSLTNYAMPLIRYAVGDRARVGGAACKDLASIVNLEEVTGRVTDSFVRADGAIISANFFIHFLGVVYNSGWVRKVQVIQEDYSLIRIKLVVIAKPSYHELRRLEDTVIKVMGAGCAVIFDFVEDIPPTPSGKYRYTISMVDR